MATNTDSPRTIDEPLASVLAHWRKTVEAELKGAPFDKKLVTRTPEGVALRPLYTAADLAGLGHIGAAPGAAPFVRGVSPDGYKRRSWEFCQELSAATPAELNAALLRDLMAGQNSVELPSAMGRPGAFEEALAGVELSAIPVHLKAGPRPQPAGDAYLAFAAARGVSHKKLLGSVTADPLGCWVRSGCLPDDLDALFDELAAWVGKAAAQAPALRTVGVDATLWSDAGASSDQEMAFAVAAGAAYLRALVARGVAPDVASSRLRFSFAAGPRFFMEVAKFRAFRLLWSRVLKAFGVEPAAAVMPAVHARTGRWNKTLHDAHVNMLRVTTEALSAVLGGVDSLHIAPFDEVSGRTDDFSRRVARNVHTLLAEEFGFTEIADPAGGSWYVETLTDELARKAWDLFRSVEREGGLPEALRKGVPQKLVIKVAADKGGAIDLRRAGLIGTNLFPNLSETPLKLHAAPPARGRAIGVDLIAAPPAARAAEPIERLRAASAGHAARTGKAPQVFLAKVGPVKQHKARADFSAGFFAVGGFRPAGRDAFATASEAAAAAAASGAPVAVLCSTDETYPELVPVFARELKAARPDVIVVLAGLPAEPETVAAFRAAGIDEFIHVRANVREILTTFLKKIGALA